MSDKNVSTMTKLGAVSVTVPNPVIQKIELEEGWIVLFKWDDLPPNLRFRNLWMFDKSGKILWQVEEGPKTSTGQSPWAGIRYAPMDERWEVETSGCWVFELNTETGATKFLYNTK